MLTPISALYQRELIRVSSVDLQVRDNVKQHHTSEFDITDATLYDSREFLVVRRGQGFDVTVNFNRPFDKEKDNLKFIFQFGMFVLIRHVFLK